MRTAREPLDPRDDADLTDERSSVRPRVAPSDPEPLAAAPDTVRSPSPIPPPASRDVEALVRVATALLSDLPRTHPRARLLALALLRKDAAVLTSLVQELSGGRQR